MNLGSITHWFFKTSPEFFQRLERGEEDLIVVPKNKIKIKDMRLIVPPGLEVYVPLRDYFRGREANVLGELFFTAAKEEDASRVYASLVKPAEDKSLNRSKNKGDLLRYGWYNNSITAKIVNRVVNNDLMDILCNLPSLESGLHPFYGYK